MIILSRIKTNGSYSLPPKYDINYNKYSNKIDVENITTIEQAEKWIKQHGERSRIYYICDSPNIHVKIDEFNDVSNGYVAIRRYCFTNQILTRLCLSKPKAYEDVYNNVNNWKRYSVYRY